MVSWTKSTSDKRKKIDKLSYIKIKIFSVANYTIKKVERKSTEWEKILADHIFDKGVPSRIHKKKTHLQFNHNKTNNPNKK